ncbi:LytTR family transcriptional regulator [Octadecabacter sp.]|nr:LytTR family transcriptional regulator [Octadecabacter sp.]
MGRKISNGVAFYCTIRVVVAWAVIAVVTAIAGPFGTFDSQPFVWRLGYWSSVIAVSLPIAISIRVFWHEIINANPIWLEDQFVVLTMAIVFGPLLVSFNNWMVNHVEHPALDWRLTVASTYLISLAAVSLGNIFRGSVSSEKEVAVLQRRDRLMERIDVAEGARLAKVSSDNHHVRIVTDDGVEHRVLMRLRDAVAEIDVEDGICVHRSHWIALHHIDRMDIVDNKEVVRMLCGQIVPVGPKYRSQLVQVGVIAA